MRMRFLLGLATAWLLLASQALAVEGYYQHPALHGQTLVFVAEGDLWRVDAGGGQAQRLTARSERVSHPAISPDGQQVAFSLTGQAGTDVWLMSLSGGQPWRLSFEGSAQVAAWSPDGEVVYASSHAIGPNWRWLLRAVNPETGERRDVPLDDARELAFDDQGGLLFSRFGLAVTADNAREYRGGAMAQLWHFGDGDDEARRLAEDHAANLTRPMWWQGQLYLQSDASGAFNLKRLDLQTGEFEALTDHQDFEVRAASLNQGRIVYQHGADIRLFDLASGEDHRLDIRLLSDRAGLRSRWLSSPMEYLDHLTFSPQGDRVVVTARGRLAIASSGQRRLVEIDLPTASRARHGLLSPDGEWLYAVLDATGEQEIWRFPADGSGSGEALTDDGGSLRLQISVSPDGRWLAHEDKRGRLWLLDLERGRNRQIDDSAGEGYGELQFSPDSRALAIVRADSPLRRRQILLHHIGGDTVALTSDRYESFSPAFSADGRWLYFLSNRHFSATPGSPWGDRNLGPMFDRRAGIFALALQPGNDFPLRPRNELHPEYKPAEQERLPAIDVEGLAERLYQVDVSPGNYHSLQLAGDRLLLIDRPLQGDSRLLSIAFPAEQPELTTLAEGVSEFALSADRKRLMLRRNSDQVYITELSANSLETGEKQRLRLDGWRLALDPGEEWQMMFDDAWRMHREHLFDPAMRGQDWPAIAEKYRPLVARIASRAELDDVLAQMVAELGVLHSQVRGGDMPVDKDAEASAWLGAEFEAVDQGLRVRRIYRSDPEQPLQASPLARPGVDVRQGDVIHAINARPVRNHAELVDALAHQAGQQVRLDIRRGRADHAVIVEPVDAWRDEMLRYLDWVTDRRQRVEQASDGRFGYLHLRAMGPNDMAEFAREFYAAIDREGLIIDVRRNRGGNIDSWIIEKLLRRSWAFWQPPHQAPYWNMQQSFRGHLVVLIDPLTYSDGETFAAGVKALGLGPLIGQRTAGAGVWLSDRNRLVDGGLMRVAETGQFAADGRWLIEGIGVAPDIVVENPPHASYRGEDAQLERAIEELDRLLQRQAVEQPVPAPIPPRAENAEPIERL